MHEIWSGWVEQLVMFHTANSHCCTKQYLQGKQNSQNVNTMEIRWTFKSSKIFPLWNFATWLRAV